MSADLDSLEFSRVDSRSKIKHVAELLSRLDVAVRELRDEASKLQTDFNDSYLNSLKWKLGKILALASKMESDNALSVKRRPDWIKRLELFQSLDVFDHIREIGEGDKSVIISEPYNTSMQGFVELIDFCSKNNLKFSVSGDSRHAPPFTFRITLKPSSEL